MTRSRKQSVPVPSSAAPIASAKDAAAPAAQAAPPSPEPQAPSAVDTAPLAPEPALPADAEAAYHACVSEALALGDHEYDTFNGNPQVTWQNAQRGVLAVLAERAAIDASPDAPTVDFARVASTLTAASALQFATVLASNASLPRSALAAMRARMYAVRDMLLTSASALVKVGVYTQENAATVAAIQQGNGPIDAANDCVALASLFRATVALVHGRSPVTPELVDESARLGTQMLQLLKPDGVANAPAVDTITRAAEVRDRLAALLARRYAYVARVGGWLWGHELAEHVPPLRSRSVGAAADGEDERQPDPQPDPQPEPQPA